VVISLPCRTWAKQGNLSETLTLQLVERLPYTQNVGGSSPSRPPPKAITTRLRQRTRVFCYIKESCIAQSFIIRLGMVGTVTNNFDWGVFT